MVSRADPVYHDPTGAFRDVRTDSTWLVNLQIDEFGAYTYWGTNLQTADSLSLSRAEISDSSWRQTYTFRNGAYQYIIAHQPADPDYLNFRTGLFG
ncbi:MAG: hypothetical protein F6K30_14390 [Cyanothece sp. SIO2G6]|nr:hypothetical protein [Cyanothece sp. SIO2G6]